MLRLDRSNVSKEEQRMKKLFLKPPLDDEEELRAWAEKVAEAIRRAQKTKRQQGKEEGES